MKKIISFTLSLLVTTTVFGVPVDVFRSGINNKSHSSHLIVNEQLDNEFGNDESDLSLNYNKNGITVYAEDGLFESDSLSHQFTNSTKFGNKPPKVIAKLLVYENKKIRQFINMYVTKKRHVFLRGLQRYNIYMPTIKSIFVQHGLPERLSYLAVVESNLNPKALSKAGAYGIWQFMRSTGKMYGLKSNTYYDDRLNVQKSSHAAARHLKDLYKMFGSWELALAAYNSGPGNVRKALARNKRLGRKLDFWSLKLPRETKGYVPAFFAVNIILDNLADYNFDSTMIDRRILPTDLEYRQIKVKAGVTFDQIEKKLGISKMLLAELNPEYKFKFTPPVRGGHLLKVPGEARINYLALNNLKSEKLNYKTTHTIRRGDNLGAIARRYSTSVSKLRHLNPGVRALRLRPGKKLLVSVSASYKKGATKVVNRKARLYRIERGDTLTAIARNFGVTVKSLLKLNPKIRARASRIKAGEVLTIR